MLQPLATLASSGSTEVPVHTRASGPLHWQLPLPPSSPGLFLPLFQSLCSNTSFSGTAPSPTHQALLSHLTCLLPSFHALPLDTLYAVLMCHAHGLLPEPPPELVPEAGIFDYLIH